MFSLYCPILSERTIRELSPPHLLNTTTTTTTITTVQPGGMTDGGGGEASTSAFGQVVIRLVQLIDGEQGDKRPLYSIPGIDGQGKSITGQAHDIDIDEAFCVKSSIYPTRSR